MNNPLSERSPSFTSFLTKPCLHSRAIDDVLTKDGRKTGAIRCVECGAVIPDPHRTAQEEDAS